MRLPKGVPLTALLASIVLSACSGTTTPSDQGTPSDANTPSATSSPNGAVEVALVNYELVASTPNRFMVGLILPDNRMVAYGSVQMRFQALDAGGQPTGSASEDITGTYLAVPGTDPGDPEADPQAIAPATARGVYELEGVRFGGAGVLGGAGGRSCPRRRRRSGVGHVRRVGGPQRARGRGTGSGI